ncbi:MAG: acyl-CoA dehydrogenase C-terminal domain-containing protein [Pseudorhodoplanes sp.]|nr:3-methylmercaptopropionyl-CoA dehydrogenase [Pseudorhodoplanes sp.]MBW7948253.1 acyl-CoA dehydrogenase C-terminal domain-containing protein [Pseudorhodoplanes sp.]MCQ3941965.1 acyl-CoA dehydrogenase [Alphaproteobacteria bacterium]GIK79604.1 MAG: acyl-CoA dehydrogenase [Alphaproteobacteria bacterium]
MPTYQAPVDEVTFILNDVLRIERFNNLPGFAEATPDVVEAILVEAGKFCTEVLAPLNRTGDEEGCTRHEDGRVTTPKGFREAYRQMVDGGWLGLAAPAEFGGQGLPGTLTVAVNEFLASANLAFSMYPGLVQGAVAALLAHGSDAAKKVYLPKLISGVWAGTMNLTEPHCGTDLGLLRTKAMPQPDGSYKITGTKIFISGGEQDLTENIIHLVLARIEGAPAGTKGISLFIVPKILPNADGSLGARNGVSCGSLEHKMGIKASATCVMNYDNATGFLIGEANRGLQAMFVMMNEARLAVGVQGLALSEVAYQNAVTYAKERRQGRALSGAKEPNQPADPIIVHPDVRRMLMTIKAFNEAARALALWTALKGDIAWRSPDEKERQAADDHMGLLTPVVKGVLTDIGFANTVMAQQVFGGHGYIAESGMEQFVRDARIPMIYEGANGIQALDLVGRKLPKDGGRALQTFFAEVQGFINEHKADEAMKPYVGPLNTALSHLQQATMWFMQNALAKPDHAGAGANDYMHLFGLVALGYMWCCIVKAAREKLKAGANGATERMNGKLVTARFFMERMLPETATHLARIQAGADSMMALGAEGF